MSAGPTHLAADKSHETGLSWGHLLYVAAVTMALALLVLMVFLRIPLLIVLSALFAWAAWLYRRRERPGAIVLTVLFFLLLLVNLPFIVPSLAVPASTADFLPTVVVSLAAIVGAVSGVAVLRRRGAVSDGMARRVAVGAVAVLVMATALTAVAKIAYPEVTAHSGDIALAAENFEFSEPNITTNGGRVAVFLENKDQTLHTFTIEELGVDLQIPAGEPARIAFDAEPGTYEFVCRPHAPGMAGTLRVSD